MSGYVVAVEWSWRRTCSVLGQSHFSLDHRLDKFVPFETVFAARARELDTVKSRTFGPYLHPVKSFLFHLDLVIAERREEEAAVAKLGSLVVFSRRRFGKASWRWKIYGSGKEFLTFFEPYKRPQAALARLERERSLGHDVRLASWKMKRLTRERTHPDR